MAGSEVGQQKGGIMGSLDAYNSEVWDVTLSVV